MSKTNTWTTDKIRTRYHLSDDVRYYRKQAKKRGDWKPRTDFKNYIAQAMRRKVRNHDRR